MNTSRVAQVQQEVPEKQNMPEELYGFSIYSKCANPGIAYRSHTLLREVNLFTPKAHTFEHFTKTSNHWCKNKQHYFAHDTTNTRRPSQTSSAIYSWYDMSVCHLPFVPPREPRAAHKLNTAPFIWIKAAHVVSTASEIELVLSAWITKFNFTAEGHLASWARHQELMLPEHIQMWDLFVIYTPNHK